MKTHFKILVIGGGNAGISAAAQIINKKPGIDIAIIEPSEKHYYQPAWTLVGGGTFNMQDTIRDQKSCMPAGATWIKDAADKFIPEENKVVCKSGTTYTYDYLIAAPGIQLDWHKIKGAKENLGKNGVTTNYLPQYTTYTWELLKNFKGGNAVFTNPNTPIKCGGAPQKIMYLVGDYVRKHNLQSKSNIHFYSGGGVIFGIEKYAKTLNKVIQRYNINTHFKYNLVEIKGEEKIAVFETVDTNGVTQHVEQKFDMIHVVPPQSAPDFIKSSPLAVKDNPLGWIDVNKHTLQHNQYKNIFACGDATSTPNAKTGAAVRKQVPVLVANLFSLMEGKELKASYNGYGSCPLVTGYGKLVMAEFDYNNNPVETFPFDQSKERWSMWLLKKYLLPWMYWHKILKGTA
jgi:sulfide:quinone oxidoreductase